MGLKALTLAIVALYSACGPCHAQLLGVGPRMDLSDKGRALIYEFETGGAGVLPSHGRPEWPKGASGVTVGVGYDCGYNIAPVIRSDWHVLTGNDRLSKTAGLTGQRAHAVLPTVADILVTWQFAADVFEDVTVAKFYGQACRAFPGLDRLRPNAQAALVSLVFNRGPALAGPRREEMRNIRDLVPKRDYAGIAAEIRAMKHLWAGTEIYNGMVRRRNAEAQLVETP